MRLEHIKAAYVAAWATEYECFKFSTLKADAFLSSLSLNKCGETPSLEQPCV